MEVIQKKKSKLMEFNISGQLSDSEFLNMNKSFAEELKEAEAKILELEQQMFSQEEFRKHMDVIRSTMEAARREVEQGMVSTQWISKYIDKIFVTPESDGSMRLDIRIFTGESTKKYLKSLRVRVGQMITPFDEQGENPCATTEIATDSRMGHMFKKMIEAYEQGMQ